MLENTYGITHYVRYSSTLHSQHMVASTWLGDHQGRLSVPTTSLHKLHMACYQVLYLLTYLISPSPTAVSGLAPAFICSDSCIIPDRALPVCPLRSSSTDTPRGVAARLL